MISSRMLFEESTSSSLFLSDHGISFFFAPEFSVCHRTTCSAPVGKRGAREKVDKF